MDAARLEALCDEALFFRAWHGTYELQMPSASAIAHLRRSFPDYDPLIRVVETKLGEGNLRSHFGDLPANLFSEVSLALVGPSPQDRLPPTVYFPPSPFGDKIEDEPSTPPVVSADTAEIARVYALNWNFLSYGVETAASILTKEVQLRRFGLQYQRDPTEVVFYDRWAQLTENGIPLLEILPALREVGYLPPDVHTAFVAEVEKGRPLEDVMASFPGYFSIDTVKIVKESSDKGELDVGLKAYAQEVETNFRRVGHP